jgi:hypothetical protein
MTGPGRDSRTAEYSRFFAGEETARIANAALSEDGGRVTSCGRRFPFREERRS